MKVLHLVFMLFLTAPFLTAQESGWIDLFNGKDLDGWVKHGDELWYVEDGLLVCESGPKGEYGYLSTKEFYDDFVLMADFKQEADGNSGIFFRSTFEGTKVSGWQVEVAPTGKHTGGVYESYGRGWLIKPAPEKEKVLKMGAWNTLKIQVAGSSLKTWLNGVEMIQLEDEKIGEGKGAIALQIHDGGGIKVLWKNIKLIPLTPM
jgi:hypothetical protein